ncbi:MAG: YlxR family protein [Dehalococcoidia bacterium]
MVPTRTTNSGQARPRHVPQRTCVACRRTGDQRTFVRLVRAADGTVEVDERGRAPGRGAYLCRTTACWERGARGALNAALRTNINGTNREGLIAYGRRFATPAATTGEDGAAAPLDPPGARESGVA